MKHLALSVALLAATTSVLGQDFTPDQEIQEADAVTEFKIEKIFAEQDRQLELWSDLQKSGVAGAEPVELDVWLDEAQRARLYAADKGDAQVPSNLIGVHQAVQASFSMSDWDPSGLKRDTSSLGQAARRADGSFVWTTSVRSAGASALRLRFTGFDLPKGAALYIYNDDGQAHGPYRGQGPHGSGEFWSHAVFGDTARVQLQVDAKASALFGQRPASFEIAKISHLGDSFQLPALLSQNKADCSANVDCVENAECYDWDELSSARRGVAYLSYEEEDAGGTSYGCTGGLLNDKDSSGRTPWLLTAHHCISSETEADSVEAYFQYQSNCGSCNGSYVDSVLGADLWATESATDFTLLELSELPSSWTLMGWTNATVLDNVGELLYRISHPKGSPQSVSTHEVVNPPSSGNRIKTENVLGTTEGISSGSPIFRDNRKVVGQLIGKTIPDRDLLDYCDPSTFKTIDGPMSTYWKSVRPYLSSPSNTYKMHVSEVTASVLNAGVFNFTFARVTVVDERGNGIPRAVVRGSFSGDVSGFSTGVTDDQGQATLINMQPVPSTSTPSFTFCVSDLTHNYFNTYDSGSNEVTCASH